MRELTSLEGNRQLLDGGACFGNASKAVWSRWVESDDLNRIPLACRCLLVQESDRNILLEAGVGAFFEPRLRERFGIHDERHRLLDELKRIGLEHTDIDFVILSHLHFDHVGGLLTAWREDEAPELLFPNARYLVGEQAWARARKPHFRDRASFIPALNNLLEQSGRLEIVNGEHSELLGEGYRFHHSDGHTPGMLLTEIAMPDGPVVYGADLIPGAPWLHLPITMGYDRYPERLIDEKQALLKDLLARGGRVVFTHDPDVALASLQQDERGRYGAASTLDAFTGLAR
ncbi:MAG: MBL fold metallo-hydrolase [Pseudomonadota bacterium]|nr:MBL fold metallo-hydrolase [Pseudomonadota bacterium]